MPITSTSPNNVNPTNENEKDQIDPELGITEKEKQALLGRAGGVYIPPHKLKLLQAKVTNKNTDLFQRMSWEALKKSINGLINKVNTANIKMIVPELFQENLIRGRGLLCKSIMKAQQASLPFTPVYAALIAVINTKFPNIGELLLSRLIMQFKRAYKRNDKTVCIAVTKFLAGLFNQKIVHEIIALQLLTLLLERPTDDSVEVAVSFLRDTGSYLTDVSSKATNSIFERFRAILHEGVIDKRTQYMVEVLFQVRRDKFSENPAIEKGLDLVEEEEQITHFVSLDEDYKSEEMLNIYKFDKDFIESEEKYEKIKKEILGDDSDDESEQGSDESDESEDEVDEANENDNQKKLQIIDETNTNVVNLRRAIYLTIMSSLNFEECSHKLMKLNLREEDQMELCNMIIECCSQERTYLNFYGLIGERYAKFSQVWAEHFCTCFEETYKTIHRFETNRLRNIGKYFSHLLSSDAITWQVFSLVKLTEQDTTSSSRIFIKILFQELVEALGLVNLKKRLQDPTMIITVQTESGTIVRGAFDGLFPKDNPRNTRFAINYFTSIGLGGLTEDLREHLKNAPKLIMAQQREGVESDTDSDSSSDSSSSSSSSSDSSSSDSSSSDEDEKSRKRKSTKDSPRRRKSVSPRDERRGGDRRKRSESPRDRRRKSEVSPKDERRGEDRRKRSESPRDRRRKKSDSPKSNRRSGISPREDRRRSAVFQREDKRRSDISPREEKRRSDISPRENGRRSDISPREDRRRSDISPREDRRRSDISPKDQKKRGEVSPRSHRRRPDLSPREKRREDRSSRRDEVSSPRERKSRQESPRRRDLLSPPKKRRAEEEPRKPSEKSSSRHRSNSRERGRDDEDYKKRSSRYNSPSSRREENNGEKRRKVEEDVSERRQRNRSNSSDRGDDNRRRKRD
ncbi:pre-mRNA-splicing factor cwc22 [Clydaea vesicula]|uniref:Pre-mRNA-splicing factor cwc22 n=1 Tax=Clydaea vesicula TaxID=447962 RepID=A0AAD5XTW7_9FUNG|nr:pre-mRNA-splicing factor cwc22 [Clydaea vesicula]